MAHSELEAEAGDIRQDKAKAFFRRHNSISFLLSSQNLLNLQSGKSLACIERIQECKTFGKFLYERK